MGLPRLRGVPGRYVDLIDGRIPGAGPGAAIYFRFAAPLDRGPEEVHQLGHAPLAVEELLALAAVTLDAVVWQVRSLTQTTEEKLPKAAILAWGTSAAGRAISLSPDPVVEGGHAERIVERLARRGPLLLCSQLAPAHKALDGGVALRGGHRDGDERVGHHVLGGQLVADEPERLPAGAALELQRHGAAARVAPGPVIVAAGKPAAQALRQADDLQHGHAGLHAGYCREAKGGV